ncbi:hypothetical protein [Capillimicrobium parvum]|uniref:Uncharacterized protein n=1 Tax=Capillimicrobium parvum TaxID=2884022 RepID=A0A9E6XZT4_9ACTN|nr:hypothetical protein [Capillimicrobium parvum]UGS37012.1 hypothetical protein DSM104329_03424 [Capillimicrobium parvum]
MADDAITGKPDIDTDSLGHVKGTKQGNSTGNYERMKGHNPDGTSTAVRSTGINPKGVEPIDPRMPNLSPG